MDTLDSVVSNFLMESGYGDAEYTRAYHIGLRGLKELLIDIDLGDIYTAKLFINPDGTANTPEDCLKVVRIYRLLGDREVSLTRNKDLSKLGRVCGVNCRPSCNCNRHNVRPDPRYGTSPYWDGGSLGKGSWENNGEYYISGDLIYLDTRFGNSCNIFVDYKALPCDEREEPYVHEYIKEAVISYIRWKFHINRKNQDKWDKQYFEKEWHREKRNARYRIKAPTKQELNQISRQSTKLGLKS